PSSFFHHTPTPQIYPLSLHDALPIFLVSRADRGLLVSAAGGAPVRAPGFDRATLVGPGGRFAIASGYPAAVGVHAAHGALVATLDRKSTRLNSSHDQISYAVFCLKKK